MPPLLIFTAEVRFIRGAFVNLFEYSRRICLFVRAAALLLESPQGFFFPIVPPYLSTLDSSLGLNESFRIYFFSIIFYSLDFNFLETETPICFLRVAPYRPLNYRACNPYPPSHISRPEIFFSSQSPPPPPFSSAPKWSAYDPVPKIDTLIPLTPHPIIFIAALYQLPFFFFF